MFVLEVTFDSQCAPPEKSLRRREGEITAVCRSGTFIGRVFGGRIGPIVRIPRCEVG